MIQIAIGGRGHERFVWLSEMQWAAIEPHLPRNQPGAQRVDDHRIISGIIHVLKVGCRWCDCPAEYGPSTTVYNRFNRWSRRRFWTGCSRRWRPATRCRRARRSTRPTSRRSEPHSAEKGGAGAGDRSLARRPDHQDPRAHRRRRTPLRDHAHAGQRRRRERGSRRFSSAPSGARYILADKGYDAMLCGARSVASGRAGHSRPSHADQAVRYDRTRYKERHLIENAFCRHKGLPPCRHAL